MSEYHEPENELSPLDRDFHRALTSVKEEIEAVDWYHQRVVASHNEELKKVMAHNRDEEIEHACMGLEWLRRNMPAWDKHLRTYLFKDESIVEIEKEDTSGSGKSEDSTSPSSGAVKSLGIGSLKNNESSNSKK